MSFLGKTAIVTGGTRGIGRAICLELASKGCNIAFNYLKNKDLAESLEEQMKGSGGKALSFQADVGDFIKAQEMVEEVREVFGEINFLINNAGMLRDKALYRMAEEDWETVLTTNLKGVFNFTRLVIVRMMKQGHGRILNIASVSGLKGVTGQTNYCASKAGVIGFTKALAREVGRFNITVNAIAPGFIETEMIQTHSDEHRKAQIKSIPLRRYGQAEEVAKLAVFLLSDDAGYITGQVIPIDGGLTA